MIPEPNADRIQVDLLIEILGVARDIAENTSNAKVDLLIEILGVARDIAENTSNANPATVRVTAGVAVGVLGGLWLYTLTVVVPLLALAMCVR